MSPYSYDLTIAVPEDWAELTRRRLDIVIDPFIFRIGQFFLEGKGVGEPVDDVRWNAVQSDLGALVSFFDLIVLHDKVPAFNYRDTFDTQLDFGDRLGAVLNTAGDK